jgi:hypothetical protein
MRATPKQIMRIDAASAPRKKEFQKDYGNQTIHYIAI